MPSYMDYLYSGSGDYDPSKVDYWAAQGKFMGQRRKDVGEKVAGRQSGLFSNLAGAGYEPEGGGAFTSGSQEYQNEGDKYLAEEQNRSAMQAAQMDFEQKKWLEEQRQAEEERKARGSWGWLKGLAGVAGGLAPFAPGIGGLLGKGFGALGGMFGRKKSENSMPWRGLSGLRSPFGF